MSICALMIILGTLVGDLLGHLLVTVGVLLSRYVSDGFCVSGLYRELSGRLGGSPGRDYREGFPPYLSVGLRASAPGARASRPEASQNDVQIMILALRSRIFQILGGF